VCQVTCHGSLGSGSDSDPNRVNSLGADATEAVMCAFWFGGETCGETRGDTCEACWLSHLPMSVKTSGGGRVTLKGGVTPPLKLRDT